MFFEGFADELNEGREKSKMIPGFLLKQLNGC